MAAVTAAVLGAASLGYGIYSRIDSNNQAQRAAQVQQQGALVQAQAAQMMHGISVEQAASSSEFATRDYWINAQAATDSLGVSQQSQAINRELVGLGQQMEIQRKQAMELDARRKGTEIIRQQQRARSMALTTATKQGAGQGSGLQGGYGQISGQTGVNALGISQNLQIGQNMFGINSQITDQKIAASNLEDQYALMRFASQNQKAQLSYDYAQINAMYQTRMADAQSLASRGQGQINQGSGMASIAQNNASMANMYIGAASTIAGMGQPLNNIYNNYFSPTPTPTDVGSTTSWDNGYYTRTSGGPR